MRSFQRHLLPYLIQQLAKFLYPLAQIFRAALIVRRLAAQSQSLSATCW